MFLGASIFIGDKNEQNLPNPQNLREQKYSQPSV